MGLAQRRITEEYKATSFIAWRKKFKDIVGYDLPIEVKWDSLQSEDYQDPKTCFEWYDQVFFRPLETVFKSICSDKMGKDALKESLKKIVIDGTEGSSYKSTTFEKGVLTICHKFYVNVAEEKDRADGWRKLIESKI